jgi:pimeloyl-ACP methyl ester carboxylesterase
MVAREQRARSGFLTAVVALALAAGISLPLLTSRPRAGRAADAGLPPRERAPARPKLPPLAAEGWLVELPLDGHLSASVSVPLGATEPRPIVVALHGMGDRPEWQCGTWRGITAAYPFVLCPRGVPLDRRGTVFTYGDLTATTRELRAALAALKNRFGSHVASGSIVLTGYSLGAMRAALIARAEPAFFERLVLVEGGHETWSSSLAAIFQRGGGKRLAFVCAQSRCKQSALVKTRLSERAGVEAQLIDAGELGHVFDGRVAAAVKQHWPWVVANDPRFGSTTAPGTLPR